MVLTQTHKHLHDPIQLVLEDNKNYHTCTQISFSNGKPLLSL